MSDSEKSNSASFLERDGVQRALVLAGLVVFTVFALGCFPLWWYGLPGDANSFGDSFGFMNTIFSGLAFAGVIVTLWMQREELQLQRQELRETKEEMRRSADAQSQSEKRLTTAATLSALESLREELLARSDRPVHILERSEAYVVKSRIENSLLLFLQELGLRDERPLEGTLQWVAECMLDEMRNALYVLESNDLDYLNEYVDKKLPTVLSACNEHFSEGLPPLAILSDGVYEFLKQQVFTSDSSKSPTQYLNETKKQFEELIVNRIGATAMALAEMDRLTIVRWRQLFSAQDHAV
ncbi:hypothetical protein [Planctomicrobium sp. SH527]|uniref:hypothetical protein n=1 Tax=Planctomicrobium sp. SH527 TaxID=3448123 RepID=UPI003F5C84B9